VKFADDYLINCSVRILSRQEVIVKWAAMYFVGFVILVGGVLAALWKLGILDSIGTTWTVIGVVIVIGLGIMIAVSHSGSKENIEIDRK
jgi:ABC-type multidrug transport system permease subunit